MCRRRETLALYRILTTPTFCPYCCFTIHSTQSVAWVDLARDDYQACPKRFRPIIMSTMAAMFGAVPLA
jgi:hypothetical protein